jgi:ATP-dependent RNA helicase RhlE
MKTFSELSLSAPLKSNLAKHGFAQPTPVQAQAIPPALAGRDLVATAQTGTGKTLAFVLPVIHRLQELPSPYGIRAVILSPTRELALQIHETFAKMGDGTAIRVAVVVGGINERTQLQSIRKGAQVLIATPGRLFDFLSLQLLDLGGVVMLVLDEADRVLDMAFLPTTHKIMAAMPAERQTLSFSATIESSVKHRVETHVRNAAKRGADRLSKKLAREGVRSAAIHGDRIQNQRNHALRGFQERANIAFWWQPTWQPGGIHVEGISHVVNYDLPQVPEDFIHRVGRTGRAGARGTASTFAMRSERADIEHIERKLETGLERREVPNDIPREQKGPAPVIVIPSTSPKPQRRVRSLGPKDRSSRRVVRRAV